MKTPRSDARFSLISCGTEESFTSSCPATPLDLSPCASPSTVVITVVALDTHPGRTQLPMVVSRRQHRHHHDHNPQPHTTLLPHQEHPNPLAIPQHHESSLGPGNSCLWLWVKNMVGALSPSLRPTANTNRNVAGNNGTDHVLQQQLAARQTSPNRQRTKRFFFLINNKHRVRPWPKD